MEKKKRNFCVGIVVLAEDLNSAEQFFVSQNNKRAKNGRWTHMMEMLCNEFNTIKSGRMCLVTLSC